jgi:LmbE family N-acetylglucosaminyl deacetylase
MNVVIIAAHPDDEVLGCGGTIARLTGEGHDVYVGILGEGITSRCHKGERPNNEMVQNLQDQSRQVSRLLGVKELCLYNFSDNQFDTVPLLEIIKTVETLINRFQPQIVYTHHGGDLNIDHVIAHRAVMTATRPVKNCPVKEIYAFEVPSATEWAFGQFKPAFHPNVFVDISATSETKVQAMQIYESEVHSFPHPRSSRGLRSNAERWGSSVGLHSAEAFQLIRKVCRAGVLSREA